MVFTFDRQRFMQNLQTAMEQAGVKANELEQRAGVYAGYISRLKGEEAKLPGLDVIWRIAKVLEVSLDRLIEGSFERSTANLAYMEDFIRELFRATVDKELDWKPVHLPEIQAVLSGKQISADKAVPFLSMDIFADDGEMVPNRHEETPFGGSGIRCGKWRVRSLVFREADTWLNGPCFITDFGDGRNLYIARVCGPTIPMAVIDEDCSDDSDCVGRWYELVVNARNENGDNATLLCSTYGQGSQLAHVAGMLYEELCRHEWDYRIDDNVRLLIDGFMTRRKAGKTEPVASRAPLSLEEDVLPFL